jgi:Copper type II ascorbate-dependent monooxygenase, C-terminal domain
MTEHCPRVFFGPMLLTLLSTAGCGGGSETTAGGVEATLDQTPGIHPAGGDVAFRTDPFTLDPGQERFICYTQTLEQDLVVDGYAHDAKRFLHHVIFAKTSGNEPEGSSDCDVLFRFNWDPLFLAGAGASEIRFPDDTGHVLPAGTRILAQLHLLNATTQSVTDSVEIRMHPSSAKNPRPMGSYAFGNFNVNLPPLQPSTLTSVCTVQEKVQFVAAFPHMHLLGQSLTFEVGPSEDKLTKVFERNPYSFDDQRLELIPLTLNPGDVTRVTCNYENTRSNTVTFGESTENEMCFLLAFAADRQGVGGCVVGTPSSLGEAPPAQ